ncbi:MAG TPA: porin [Usitatibacter sp.]|nr:porin [Usitatibacter sp.]
MPAARLRKTFVAATFAALCATAGSALAQVAFNFSGYGTLGVVRSDNDRADYQVDLFRPSGPGHSDEWSARVDSRLGAQVSATLSPRLSAVVQVLSQQRYDDTFRPIVEWANVKYEVLPDLNVRAGRVVLPTFLVTDTRRVGYANVWVRPPVEVYSLVPITTNDGMDMSWRKTFGDFRHTLEASFGRNDPHFPEQGASDQGQARARKLFVAVSTLERGASTFRLSYGRTNLTVESLDPLFDAFRQFGPAGEAIARRYELRDREVHFVGVGASYDPGPWFAMAEWAKFDTHAILGSRSAWYASGGYRLGKATLYGTFASTHAHNDSGDPGLPVSLLPPNLAPVAAALNAQLAAGLQTNPEQETFSIGVRWDVLRNAAVKVQLDEVRPKNGSRGTFHNAVAGYEPTRTRLFSVTVDFVF